MSPWHFLIHLFAAPTGEAESAETGHYPGARTDVADDILVIVITTGDKGLLRLLAAGQGGDQGVVMGLVFAVHTPGRGRGGPGTGGGRAHRGHQVTRPGLARGEHQPGPLSTVGRS